MISGGSASRFDGVGRPIAGAAYGNQGDDMAPFTRPASAPDSTDDILVGTTSYNSGGKVSSSIDPAGIINLQEYDNAGRGVRSIANYQTGAAAADDANVTTETTYNPDGEVATLTAKNPDTGDQTTYYEYGVVEMSGSDVIIASNDLLRATIYPDSVDGDDQVKYTYNRQGQTTTMTDQNGSVHSYDYDLLGRQTQDRVSTVGSDVNNAILRIATTYEVRGMVLAVTSYDNATVGSGSVKNEVKYTYNDFAQLITEEEEHVGAVVVGTYKVQYAYEPGSANTIRPTTVTYPDGRVQTFDYGLSTGDNYKLSRVETLHFGESINMELAATNVSTYKYLGLGTIVNEEYVESGVETELDYIGSAYSGFDRFGRVINQNWRDTVAPNDSVDQFLYGYDRAGNRTYRENTVVIGSVYLDELYGYDNLQRLTSGNRGELVAAKDCITSPALAQTWNLDVTGNWKGFSNFDQGTPANDLVQQRTTNAANEITDISEIVGNQWVAPAHDRSGNMTTIPQPDTPTSAYTCTYDAWNRLVLVKDGATTIGQYSYDGLNRRIRKYVPGGTDSYQHLYYNAAWQLLETREASTSPVPVTAQYQYVWSLRYIDAPVLRDDLAATPSDVRIYYTGDANFNVTSLFTDVDAALERYVYDPYGNLTIYNNDWSATQAPTVYNNSTLYTGQWRDAETGLSNYRERYYHALLGRFTSPDPILYTSGPNPYLYAAAAPGLYVDPSGEVFILAGIMAGILIAATATNAFAPEPGMTSADMQAISNATFKQNFRTVAAVVTLPVGGAAFSFTSKAMGATNVIARVCAGSLAAGTSHQVATDVVTGDIVNYASDPVGAGEKIAVNSLFWLIAGAFTGPGAPAPPAAGKPCWRVTWWQKGKHAMIDVSPVKGTTGTPFLANVTKTPAGKALPELLTGKKRLVMLRRATPKSGSIVVSEAHASQIWIAAEKMAKIPLKVKFNLRSTPYGVGPLGTGVNCTTGAANILNTSGAGSFGLLGPYGPGMAGFAPALSQSANTLQAFAAGTANIVFLPLRPDPEPDPYVEIKAKRVR